jgi:hypothetical protein
MGHEIDTGAVEAVLGAFGDEDVEDLGKSGGASTNRSMPIRREAR